MSIQLTDVSALVVILSVYFGLVLWTMIARVFMKRMPTVAWFAILFGALNVLSLYILITPLTGSLVFAAFMIATALLVGYLSAWTVRS